MSLFGGDSVASREASPSNPQTTSDDENSIPTSAQQPTTVGEESSPDNNNPDGPKEVDASSDSPSGSPSDSDSEAEDSEPSSGSNLPDRPNKFKGKHLHLQMLTRAERSLIRSLDQMRANDLGIHLYNAHTLKARLRTNQRMEMCEPWSSKYRWMHLPWRGRADQYLNWHPDDAWTAWPLPPERVPRAEEVWGIPGEDEYEAYTLKRKEEKVSEEMEDVLIGTILRQAREQWDVRGQTHATVSGEGPGFWKRNPDRDHQPRTESAVDGNGTNIVGDTVHGREPKPVFMANEERENAILKPVARSLLSDLDALLKALQHTAPTRVGKVTKMRADPYRVRRPRSQDRGVRTHTGGQSSSGLKDRFSKPAGVTNEEGQDGPHVISTEEVYRPQDDRRGPDQDDMMSDSEMSSSSEETSESEPSEVLRDAAPPAVGKAAGKATRKVSSKSGMKRKRGGQQGNIGLRDWSEILNAAATTGWDREVVHRAAQRCSALFGESMSFRVLNERDIDETAGRPIQYTPETIPPLPDCDDPGPELIRWEGVDARCPVPNCQLGRNDKPFNFLQKLFDHMKKYHEFDPFEEKNERRVGTVHNDGFLTPIMQPQSLIALSRRLKVNTVSMVDYTNSVGQRKILGPRKAKAKADTALEYTKPEANREGNPEGDGGVSLNEGQAGEEEADRGTPKGQ